MVSPAALVLVLALFFTQAACVIPHIFEPPQPSPLRATFDTTFDNRNGSMNGVACSNGEFGLAAKFPKFGDLPSFPFIGGAYNIVWNSPNCGECWEITNPETGASVIITAIDTAGAGFNLSNEACRALTGGSTDPITVIAHLVPRSFCGMT
jgi:Cerato-platanin